MIEERDCLQEYCALCTLKIGELELYLQKFQLTSEIQQEEPAVTRIEYKPEMPEDMFDGEIDIIEQEQIEE